MTYEEKAKRAKALGAKYVIGIEGEDKFLFIKDPDKTLYDMFFDSYDANPRGTKETTLKTLAISEVSDMDIFEKPTFLYSACNQLIDVLALKKSTLKTL